VYIKTGIFKGQLYQTVTVTKDGVYHKLSVIEDRADHIGTLDKNEEDYKTTTGKG